MQSNQIAFNVSFGETGTVYGHGHSLDTLLYAFDLTTEEDTFSEASIYAEESAIIELNNLKTADDIVELLNELDEAEAIRRLSDYDVTVTATELASADMLVGDYLKLERPESLRKLTREVREYIERDWQDMPQGNHERLAPRKTVEAMTDVYDTAMAYANDEWLHGDRSNEGVLTQLTSLLFGHEDASVTWDTKTDTVEFIASPEAVREFYGYDLEDSEPIPSPTDIAEYLKTYALRRATKRAEKARIEKEARKVSFAERTAREEAARAQAISEARARKASKKITQ